jgi:hypothetical protein
VQIEINGIKMEIDERYCKVIEQYKIGDPVKVLVKEYEDYKSYPGVISGFNNFPDRPTIVVAYLKTGYMEADVKFVEIHKTSSGVQLCPASDDILKFNKEKATDAFDRLIAAKQLELDEVKRKKSYFIEMFGFEPKGDSK